MMVFSGLIALLTLYGVVVHLRRDPGSAPRDDGEIWPALLMLLLLVLYIVVARSLQRRSGLAHILSILISFHFMMFTVLGVFLGLYGLYVLLDPGVLQLVYSRAEPGKA